MLVIVEPSALLDFAEPCWALPTLGPPKLGKPSRALLSLGKLLLSPAKPCWALLSIGKLCKALLSLADLLTLTQPWQDLLSPAVPYEAFSPAERC
eukprot:150702-Pyramimonas_sp.AAC.1